MNSKPKLLLKELALFCLSKNLKLEDALELYELCIKHSDELQKFTKNKDNFFFRQDIYPINNLGWILYFFFLIIMTIIIIFL